MSTTAATDGVTLLRELGQPDWAQLVGQRSCKYATVACARSIATVEVQRLLGAVLSTLAGRVLVDVRYWPHLEVGDLPGLSHWHYDCRNAAGASADVHRLYFAGAGCRTQFEAGGFQPPEGWIVGYDHDARHRVMPATAVGPRLLLRVTRTDLPAANHVGEAPLF